MPVDERAQNSMAMNARLEDLNVWDKDITRYLKSNHEQLYAQAVTLIERGDPYWLNEEQTRLVMESNRQFQVRRPEEIVFDELFVMPASEEEGQWMSTTAIFEYSRKKAGTAALRGANIHSLGHFLTNLEGILRRCTRNGTE